MRRIGVLVAGVIACGPVVPFGDADDTGAGSTAGSEGQRTDGEGGDVDDGVPPNPSDPSGATDPGGMDDSVTVSAGEGTTGEPPSECGNGVIEADEVCDDGNAEDGDGCSSACTAEYELAWMATYDGTASSFDQAHDVLIGPDDSIYVLGEVRLVVESSDLWLQQYTSDGVPGWSFVFDGVEGLSDEGAALAWTPNGQLAIVGATESMATGFDVLVLVFDPATQSIVWSRVFDGPGSGPGQYDEIDVANDVDVDAAGNVVVAATMRVGSGDYDAWLVELSPAGTEVRWEQWAAGPGGERDESHAVHTTGTNGVAWLVELDENTRANTLFFDAEGVPLLPELEHPFAAHDMVRRVDGGYAFGGLDEQDFDRRLVTAALDDGLNPWWQQTEDGDGDDDVLGVAAGPASEVAAVGTKGTDGEQSNAWIRVYAADGLLRWGAKYNGAADLEDAFRAVAFDSTSAVIAVGSETVIGQQTNVLVRKYLPL